MKLPIIIIAVAVVAASCQAAGSASVTDKRIEAARGAELDEACFKGGIDGWDELSRDTLLLREGGAWHLVTLGGACDADLAYETLSTRARAEGSTCVAPGRLENGNLAYSTCTIRSIHQWNEASSGSRRGATASPASE